MCLRAFLVFGLLSLAGPLSAADLAVLAPETWDEFAPRGKEVDCIYGDVVLRSDRLVCVIAKPVAGRNANMTVQKVGGCLIDFTRRDRQSDQLSAFYPGGKQMDWRQAAEPKAQRGAAEVIYTVRAAQTQTLPAAEVTYRLADGQDYLTVETSFKNEGPKPIVVPLVDEIRADTSFDKAPSGPARLFWAYDKWFSQAYGVLAVDTELTSNSDAKLSTLRYPIGGTVTVEPGQSHRLERRLLAAADLLELRAQADAITGRKARPVKITVLDTAGEPIPDAEITVRHEQEHYGSGRPDANGQLVFVPPAGPFDVKVAALGRGTQKVEITGKDIAVEMPQAGRVAAKIVDQDGQPIACKVQFHKLDGEQPMLGHMSGEHAVHNLYYSQHGTFEQVLPPGKYQAIVSCGPEYDAVFAELEIAQSEATPLAATLKRTVDTRGWISADFHNHASESGDNTASQYGRVLNLLGEHLEFAPCTEHNRISSYVPHLERLNATHRMATCTGIELTGNPLPLNHQNAFPLIEKPRTQDGGAPLTDVSPEVQISRLALWDNRSEKLVQQNHPDIGHLFFDRTGDGDPDGGFTGTFAHMDVIEVHPLHTIFEKPVLESGDQTFNNTIVNWLQLLNQGHRIPGVVNTDAHYNFHGSGFLRIYIKSPTDDPAEIKTVDIVHAAEKGQVVMTSGPFLEVEVNAAAQAAGEAQTTGIGGDLLVSGGELSLHVRVQCPNWFDIDRVQVLVNGRMREDLNFTRASHADRFGAGAVKFDQRLPLQLKEDAHLVVIAAGEKLTMGQVMGPDHGKDMPIAVSNPIFIDVDGGGFKANGDTLGAPLPVKGGTAKN